MLRSLSMSAADLYHRRAVLASLQASADRAAIERCGTVSTFDGFTDVLDARLEETAK
jgi:hypothetical protein